MESGGFNIATHNTKARRAFRLTLLNNKIYTLLNVNTDPRWIKVKVYNELTRERRILEDKLL